jgi:hypothetical protein
MSMFDSCQEKDAHDLLEAFAGMANAWSDFKDTVKTNTRIGCEIEIRRTFLYVNKLGNHSQHRIQAITHIRDGMAKGRRESGDGMKQSILGMAQMAASST